MSEKSGIEMLEEILIMLNLLSKKVDVLDQNIKKIANSTKVYELIEKHTDKNIPGWTKPKIIVAEPHRENEIKEFAPENGMRFKLEPTDASKIKKDTAVVNNKTTRTVQNTMVRGKMIILNNNESVPLPDIMVKVFDGKNKLLKETKTNRAGVYQFSLPVGKYVAEFIGKYKNQELVPQNKVFEIKEGMLELELK